MAADTPKRPEPVRSDSDLSVPTDVFFKLYERTPPWEIGRPQPEVVRLAREGRFVGEVLDLGCGSGENAIFLASEHQCSVVGVDLVPAAIEQARHKAGQHACEVTFLVQDILDLKPLNLLFDTVLDSGTFHVLSDDHRLAYMQAVTAVTRPGGMLYLLCFSEAETRERGPRRLTQDDIRDAFADGWTIEKIEPVRYEVNFYDDGARNWLATIRRDKTAC